MLTHSRPKRMETTLVQASKRAIAATWLEDPFWYWTHYCAVGPTKGQVVPCVSRVRECRPCLEAKQLNGRGRKLHAAAAAVVQLVSSAPKLVEKPKAELIGEFRMLPLDHRRAYGYSGPELVGTWSDASELAAARRYAERRGVLKRLDEAAVQDASVVAIVELLAPVADEVQTAIGADMQWRGKKTLVVPTRSDEGLVTKVQLRDEAATLPDTFQPATAWLDELWDKYGIRAIDAR
jgi:hypothetical protein